jgi:hypothetical protein
LETLQSQLARKEEEEEVRLKLSLEEKMAAFETNLKTQQENQEKCIRYAYNDFSRRFLNYLLLWILESFCSTL